MIFTVIGFDRETNEPQWQYIETEMPEYLTEDIKVWCLRENLEWDSVLIKQVKTMEEVRISVENALRGGK